VNSPQRPNSGEFGYLEISRNIVSRYVFFDYVILLNFLVRSCLPSFRRVLLRFTIDVVSFDPYHLWLGIAPAEQPPTLYRLLGIAPFETDKEVIDSGANRQMLYVSEFAIERPDESQTLLNELSRARLTLLNDEQRLEYEKTLREDVVAKTSPKIHIAEEKLAENSVKIPVQPPPVPNDSAEVIHGTAIRWGASHGGEPPVTILPPKVPSTDSLVSFAVEAITKTGERAEMQLFAESEDDALRIARTRGLFPYHVSDIATSKIEVTREEIAEKANFVKEITAQEITDAFALTPPSLCCCCGCEGPTEPYAGEAAEVANFLTCANCDQWLNAQANLKKHRRRGLALAVLTALAIFGLTLARIPTQTTMLAIVATLLGVATLIKLHLWQVNQMVAKAIQPTGDVSYPPIQLMPTENSEDSRILVRIENDRYRQALADMANNQQ